MCHPLSLGSANESSMGASTGPAVYAAACNLKGSLHSVLQPETGQRSQAMLTGSCIRTDES